MHISVESDPEGTLFSHFFKKLTKYKLNIKGNSIDSKETKLWNKYYQEIIQLSKFYKGKIIVKFNFFNNLFAYFFHNCYLFM